MSSSEFPNYAPNHYPVKMLISFLLEKKKKGGLGFQKIFWNSELSKWNKFPW